MAKAEHMLSSQNVKCNSETLNPTCWVGRYDTLFAFEEWLPDVMKPLNQLILISKKSSERNKAISYRPVDLFYF